jgi:hypothetical protein
MPRGRPKGSKDLQPRKTKPSEDLRAVLPFRIKASLIEAVEGKAKAHGLPPSLVMEILIARALDSEVLERVLAMTEIDPS